ncbi:DUF6236 family protein [Devosia sp.]|uniref:DUF6236 family protein n=1 Tax=Devosia sp. TaxID=1871048 RepID=UPI001B09E031|nr:DUF6236 family protein [Devosia sp.]MBO9589552.1 hypothetical protein [Devosia sp.]
MIAVTRFGMTMQSELDPKNIRNWALYWDKIDHPIGGFDRSSNAEEQFLISAGVMQRTLANESYLTTDKAEPHNGGMFDSVLDTFRKLEASQPGIWAIGRTALPATPWDHVDPPRALENEEMGRGLQIRLLSAIPVPDVDVPLEDVLAFKDRRSAELQALRAHMDDLYLSVLESPDRPLAENAAVASVAQSANEIMRAQTAFSWKLMDLSGSFNLVSAAAGFAAAQQMGLGVLPSLAAALATASVEIGPTFGLKERGDSTSAFEYVARFNNELFAGRT